MQSLEIAAIELMFHCPRCGAPMPINAIAARCPCSDCLVESELPASVWQEAFDGIEKDVLDFGAGYLRNGPAWGESGPPPGQHVEWLRGRDVPPCPQCGRGMALAWELAACRCLACGGTRPILKPTAPLAQGTPILGYVSDEPPAVHPRPRQPMHVACSACGAPLSADGSTRAVSCRFCAAVVALPDNVWTALNPPRLKRRFWLVVHVPYDGRREPLPMGRDNGLFFTLVLMWLFWCTPVIIIIAIGVPTNSVEAVFTTMFVILTLILASWARRAWWYASVCRPDHELVGWLQSRQPLGAGRVEVLLTPPGEPSRVLGRAALNVGDDRFRELGGPGGRVRAWMIPGKPRAVHVEAMPSVLE
jgi:hypothetical protein